MSSSRKNALMIETPEGVVFSYELATPVTRALAWAVDAAVIGAVSTTAAKLAQAFSILSPDWAKGLGVILYFVISTGYAMVFEWRWRGQTLGKRVMGLRVIDAQGLRLQFSQIAVRNLLRPVDTLPLFYLVGGITSLLNRHGQRLGDLAANTVVAHQTSRLQPDLDQIAPARYNSLLAYPQLAARLRSLASPEAVGIAVRALTQRDGYDPPARVELFRDLGAYFRSLVRFPDVAVEGLTDEQYVRSALRVIYGGSGGANTPVCRVETPLDAFRASTESRPAQ
ncbi:MAG TPA: RDD family protein [Bryobacteraceae bacterium]|nr:RDD family protein [Bryobacteraceae bacterium]